MQSQKKILLLEDEQELLTTLSTALREHGYRVFEITSAEEALQTLEKIIPDLIIADIKLPGIDGFDFFAEVKKHNQYQSIPFVYLTAFNNLVAAMNAKKEGAADYITKPFDLEYLLTKVRELLPQ